MPAVSSVSGEAHPPAIAVVTLWHDREPDIETDLHPWLAAALLYRAWERMENEAAEALEPPGEEEGEPEDD